MNGARVSVLERILLGAFLSENGDHSESSRIQSAGVLLQVTSGSRTDHEQVIEGIHCENPMATRSADACATLGLPSLSRYSIKLGSPVDRPTAAAISW